MTEVMILNLLHLVVGFSICLGGIMLLRSYSRLGGLLLGGLFAAEIAFRAYKAPEAYALYVPIAAFLVGGLIGALIAYPLRMLFVVLTSCVMGAVVGMIAGLVISQGGATYKVVNSIFSMNSTYNNLQILLMLAFAMLAGLLAIRFEGMMTMASTAFVGAFLLLLGLADLFGAEYPVLRYGIFQFLAWAGLGLAGLIYQNHNQED